MTKMKANEVVQCLVLVALLSTLSVAKPVRMPKPVEEKPDSDEADPIPVAMDDRDDDVHDKKKPDGAMKADDFEMNGIDEKGGGDMPNHLQAEMDAANAKHFLGKAKADVPNQMSDPIEEAQDDLKHDLKLIEEMADKGQKVSHGDLVPVDHLDAVKMEVDGHVNKEYHKEMFLGQGHDEFKDETLDSAKVKLKEIVNRADTDKNGDLSKDEIRAWIETKMKEHFEGAKEDNAHIFTHLDPDQDGVIKWKEYYLHFLLSRGFDTDKSMQHVKDYDDAVVLSQEDKDALVNYKFKWMDADLDSDNQLTQQEFMAFRHPEHSKKTLETMARNVLRGVDTNEDGVITEEEFIALPPGEVETEEYRELDRKWQGERKKEFHEIFDEDKDGKVVFKEVIRYLDPLNPVQAVLEADNLISLMDDNDNKVLSMDEIEHHSDIFISSKIVNFASSLHDEF